MMIPPVVNVGPPPLDPSKTYVCLIDQKGWMFLNYYAGRWMGSIEFRRSMEIRTADILCWMPQDGS